MKQALSLPLLGVALWSAVYDKHQLAALMWTVPMGALATLSSSLITVLFMALQVPEIPESEPAF